MKDYLDQLTSLPKPFLFLFGFIIFVFLASFYAIWQVQQIAGGPTTQNQPRLIKHSDKQSNTIFIDLEGAVVKPGVYELSDKSRLVDALRKAQGLTEQADRYEVARNFNLAKKLTDEEKVYIPFLEERQIYLPESIDQQTISLNSSSQTQLELLPGIGPVTAKKIIDHRSYSSVEELLLKKVVGEKTFEKIVDMIVL